MDAWVHMIQVCVIAGQVGYLGLLCKDAKLRVKLHWEVGPFGWESGPLLLYFFRPRSHLSSAVLLLLKLFLLLYVSGFGLFQGFRRYENQCLLIYEIIVTRTAKHVCSKITICMHFFYAVVGNIFLR